MQVINVTNKVMKYHTKGTVIVLNPGVITYVSEDLTTAKKLRDCYGSRIKFIDEQAIERAYALYSGNAKPVEPPVKEEEVIIEPTVAPEPTEPTVAPEPTEPTVAPEPTEEPTVEPELEGDPDVEVPEVKEEVVEEPKPTKKSGKGKGSKKNK